MEKTAMFDGRMLTHHAYTQCIGEQCPLHNPTNHPYRHLPQDFRNGIMVRILEDGSVVGDPDDYKVIQGNYLYQNSAWCMNCDTEIVSEYRHDFKWCPCGQVAVDGGHDYVRRAYKGDGEGWIDTSVYL